MTLMKSSDAKNIKFFKPKNFYKIIVIKKHVLKKLGKSHMSRISFAKNMLLSILHMNNRSSRPEVFCKKGDVL